MLLHQFLFLYWGSLAVPSLCSRAALPPRAQSKARLGTVVHKKTATALAVTAVKNEDQREFAKLVASCKVRSAGPRRAALGRVWVARARAGWGAWGKEEE